MHLYYTKEIESDTAVLDSVESQHCIKVLRMKEGDVLNFVDGVGGMYKALIVNANYKRTLVKIIKKDKTFRKHNYHLHIAIAPTKNMDRYEWFVEKAVEIGVDTITPILCHYSERKKLRTDRLERIMVSAMKQSIKAHLPTLNPLTNYKDLVKTTFSGVQKVIAHCEESERHDLIRINPGPSEYLILIGPEGDFHPEEINMALKNDFLPVSLGHSRLRTETAGVAVCQIISDLERLRS